MQDSRSLPQPSLNRRMGLDGMPAMTFGRPPASFFCCSLPLEMPCSITGAESGAGRPQRLLLLALVLAALLAVPRQG